ELLLPVLAPLEAGALYPPARFSSGISPIRHAHTRGFQLFRAGVQYAQRDHCFYVGCKNGIDDRGDLMTAHRNAQVRKKERSALIERSRQRSEVAAALKESSDVVRAQARSLIGGNDFEIRDARAHGVSARCCRASPVRRKIFQSRIICAPN